MRDIKAIYDWLTDGARSAARVEDVFAQLCDGLVGAGIPLWSAEVFVRTPHPHVSGRRLRWHFGSAVVVEEVRLDASSLDLPGVLRDDPPAVAKVVRLRASEFATAGDPAWAQGLHRSGVTEVLTCPLRFTDGAVHFAVWTTRSPSGFTQDHVAAIATILGPATRVAEIRALRRMTSNLLNAYVGSHAATSLLAGEVLNGHGKTVRAVILMSDMRGFTTLADRLPIGRLIRLLNAYFESQVPAIVGRGGDVLKFVGDGLLAIFRIEASAQETCAAALAAAREARARILALSASLASEGIDGVRFGLALHLGDIRCGNIGGGDRLDFTCIGSPINLAARLEALAGKLGRTIVASQAFAAHCARSFTPLGQFKLKGFDRTEAVYGVTEESVLHPPASVRPQ